MRSFRNFFTGNGEIYLPDKFLSPRLVKEALDKKFNLIIVEETSDYIKIKIIRFIRLYGAPFVWPQASIRVWVDNENDTLIFKFSWPEYLALIIPFSIFFTINQESRGFIAVIVLCLGSLMFLDTKWVSRRVRKAFERI